MSDSRKSDLLLVVTTLLAAISWMFSKEAVLLMPPLMFMAGRFLIAGLVLALIAHRSLRALDADQVRRGLHFRALLHPEYPRCQPTHGGEPPR